MVYLFGMRGMTDRQQATDVLLSSAVLQTWGITPLPAILRLAQGKPCLLYTSSNLMTRPFFTVAMTPQLEIQARQVVRIFVTESVLS